MTGLRQGASVVGSLLVGVIAAACGGPPPPGIAFGSECVPFAGSTGSSASLRDMAGSYRLVMAAGPEGNGSASSPSEGQMSLTERPSGMRQLDDSETPLSGWTDVDVEAVGARRTGNLRTDDLTAPGVLVIESDGVDGRSIFLRLGSDANRRDRVAFDAAYTVLYVSHVADEGFAGRWESGVRTERSEGYFCAQRRSE